MVASVRARLTYANVVATLALFIALGGSSYAALKITGREVKDGSLTSADIKNRSIRPADLRRGVLRAGLPGAKGEKGDKGDPGTVDTTRFYGKPEADARFLGIGATAADALELGGELPDEYRSSAVHDERTPVYSLGATPDIRTVTFDLATERKVLIIGTGEALSVGGACGLFVGLAIDGARDERSVRGETLPIPAAGNGFATVTTTTLKTLAPGPHTVALVGTTAGAGCVGLGHSSLEAVLLDG